MNERDENQLERLIHRELRSLPELAAPETLVHRVMLAVHARAQQAWWQRPWLTWPRLAQLASFALFATTVAGLVYFGASAWRVADIGNPLVKVWEWIGSLSSWWDSLQALVNAAGLVLKKAGQQYLFIGLGIAVTMYLLCVATGTACYRLAFNRR